MNGSSLPISEHLILNAGSPQYDRCRIWLSSSSVVKTILDWLFAGKVCNKWKERLFNFPDILFLMLLTKKV